MCITSELSIHIMIIHNLLLPYDPCCSMLNTCLFLTIQQSLACPILDHVYFLQPIRVEDVEYMYISYNEAEIGMSNTCILTIKQSGMLNTCMFLTVLGNIAVSVCSWVFSSPEPKAQVSFSDQNLSVVRPCRCCCRRKLFTFSSSSPEPLGQFQPNLAQSILGWMGFKFVQMKGRALFQGEIITK